MTSALGSMGHTVLAVGFILGSCILAHEIGHFVTARLAGMKVEEFLIGFPPRLWSFVRRGTRYGIGAIIFGGYVKIAGMEPGQETVEGGFYTKPRASQALVLVAGSSMNVLLAVALFTYVGLAWGTDPVQPPAVGHLASGDVPARAAGLRPGDVILAVDGLRQSLRLASVAPGSRAARLGLKAGEFLYGINDEGAASEADLIRRVREAKGPFELTVLPAQGKERSVRTSAKGMGIPPTVGPRESLAKMLGVGFGPLETTTASLHIADRPGHPVKLTIRRRGVELVVTVVPAERRGLKRVTGPDGKAHDIPVIIGQIGIHYLTRPDPPGRAVSEGFQTSLEVVQGIAGMIWDAVRRKARLEVGGPVAIVATAAESARAGWDAVLELCGLISVNLAIINLLPIPITDGGRLTLCLYEAVVRRRISRQREMAWLLAGMALIVVLFLVITFKDVFNLVKFHAP